MNNKDYGNENDNSSVIYTELNNYKFLFMGDAGVEVEEDLIEKYNLQNIDILKVGQEIKVKVQEFDKENKRLKLEYDKKGPNPWDVFAENKRGMSGSDYKAIWKVLNNET